MPVIDRERVADGYDIVAIGSGFGVLFFVHRALERRPGLKILIIERGFVRTHDWQLANGRNGEIDPRSTFTSSDSKSWNFTIGYGGGTNCWFAQTPRMHPSDFELRTRYGVAQDWPFTYDELEPYYCDAEEIMAISGPDDIGAIVPRSRPYPQPAHRFTTPDEMMKAAQPLLHFNMPCARTRIATPTRRACCSSARCNLCPVDAKFTVFNGMSHILESVDLVVEARALRVETVGGAARRVAFRCGDHEHTAAGELVLLGANAIMSPAILLASGLDDPLTGVGINEQLCVNVEVLLDGLDNFDGSTITTGINYSFYDGAFRSRRAGALIHFENRWRDGLRLEPGRWRQTLPLNVVIENHPQAGSRVTLGADGNPVVAYAGASDYARRGLAAVQVRLPDVLAPLPVEAVRWGAERPTESHMHGTLRMGASARDSVVDGAQVHHRVRNLVVVGSSVFPTCPNANPSLTVAAMSLRAADRAYGESS